MLQKNVSTMESGYRINTQGTMLNVDLFGHWNMATDISYLTDLAAAIEKIGEKPWGMLVDMRDWSLKSLPDNIFEQNVANVHLDRRFQVSECWIVEGMDQAIELLPFVEAIPHVRFKRFFDIQDGRSWMQLFELG